jgi:hypothetical protein
MERGRKIERNRGRKNEARKRGERKKKDRYIYRERER